MLGGKGLTFIQIHKGPVFRYNQIYEVSPDILLFYSCNFMCLLFPQLKQSTRKLSNLQPLCAIRRYGPRNRYKLHRTALAHAYTRTYTDARSAIGDNSTARSKRFSRHAHAGYITEPADAAPGFESVYGRCRGYAWFDCQDLRHQRRVA